MNLGENLISLSDALKNGSYKMQEYYNFAIYDPKYRMIHALHYRDRVVQHCLCDEVLAPILDKKLIYDNSACHIGKGTHFVIGRVSKFLHDFYNKYGADGYFLKCDIRKFFDNIDHEVLKCKLSMVIEDKLVLRVLYQIIDSFEVHLEKDFRLEIKQVNGLPYFIRIGIPARKLSRNENV